MKKIKLFFKIMNASSLKEIAFGFLALFIISAILLLVFEPGITKLGDSVWFCFSSVTTIGYGDFQAVTLLGRIITIILSAYGIVFVAIITGTIVSYINELQKVKAKESVNAFLMQLENLENLSQEELSQLSKRIRDKNFKM